MLFVFYHDPNPDPKDMDRSMWELALHDRTYFESRGCVCLGAVTANSAIEAFEQLSDQISQPFNELRLGVENA